MTIRAWFSDLGSGFRSFGETIMVIVNTLLLSVVYLFGVGITSLIARLSGKQFLALKTDEKEKSYYEVPPSKKKSTEDSYRQF
ncbi:MAG: hypothetical protein ABIH34_02665 [Nanoarchaeota archaeon]